MRSVSAYNKKDIASAGACPIVKKDDSQAMTPAIRATSTSSSTQLTAVTTSIGPSLSDLDSDSDELYLPAVSEAIRMLDLDSQGSPMSENLAGPSHSVLPSSGHLRLPINLVPMGSTWPTIGCCSSLLQQFVAKSQSGEPPPPPTVMLPTKGARKCFPPNDEPISSAVSSTVDPKSVKRGNDAARQSSFHAVSNATMSTTASGGQADQELDMMVPMRGLDCHPSHVSPDSGIQSVSGSPFSVHSSPVHPSGAGCTNHQPGSQTQNLVVSPCPPISSPSPPLRQKQTKLTSKLGNSKNNSRTKSQSGSLSTEKQVKNSTNRQNGGRGRRPRSCRDTASALSSGLGKDSSIIQAIQRGMNAALRLKSKDVPEEEKNLQNEEESTSTTIKSSRKKSSKKQLSSSHKKHKEVDKTTAQAVEKDTLIFSEVTSKLGLPITQNSCEPTVSQNTMLLQHRPKSLNEFKVTTATTTVRSPSPRHSKRKKKRKKYKASTHEQVLSIPMDPNLKSTLDQLCRRLDRCIISKSTSPNNSASCDKLPWVFQCRKYTITNGNSNSNSSRTKRRKLLEDPGTPSNITGVVSKRKGKSKKTGFQPTLISGISKVEETKEYQPTVASAAAAVVLSAVELLLPLKKRHHHLATSEVPVVEPVAAISHSCGSATEKPSQEHTLLKLPVNQQQQQSHRKRPANSELILEPTDSVAIDQRERKIQTTKNQKSKKSRGQKKAKTEGFADIIEAVAAGVEEPLPTVNDPPVIEPMVSSCATPVPVQEEISAVVDPSLKKKVRRRKTFNRTGFPSVKKKRKKPPSPVPSTTTTTTTPPPPPPHTLPPLSKDEVDLSTSNNAIAPTYRQAKRAKLMPKDEDEDGILPEPTSSEAASGDESNGISFRPSTTKEVQPKKRRMSTMRKRYLPAGLLSKFFKEDPETNGTTTSAPADRTKVLTYEPEEHEHGLLPAPVYCEKFLRRTKRDFQLPFDVWWLHQQGKLPGRDNLVPSWNYRKIRSNVYYDVKPPFTNDAQACNCTLPSADATGKINLNSM